MMIIKSQMPGMPPMPPMPGGDPMMGGAPPMGGDPMMGGAPPMGPPPPPPGPPPINKAIENVGEMIMDMNAQKLLASHPDADDDKLANIMWQQYGGKSNGDVDLEKTGKRTDKFDRLAPEIQDQEREDTEKRRWERLGLGKNVGDITQLGELEGLMKSLKFSVLKKLATPPAPPGGAPGGMPMASNHKDEMLRLAESLRMTDLDVAAAIRELV